MPKSETPDGNGRLSDQDRVAHDGAAVGDTSDGPGGSGRQGDGQGARWRLSNWPLRYKMAVVLLVPLLTATIFGGLRAGESLSDAGELRDGVDQIGVAERVAVLMHELQRERTLMVSAMSGTSIGSEAVDRQRARVDDAVRALSEAADTDDRESPSAAPFSHGLQRLSALRTKIDSTPLPALSAYTIYNSIIESFVGAGGADPLVADQELLRRSDLVRRINEIKEYTARQNAVLQMAVGYDEFVADLLDRARSAGARADAAVEALVAGSTIGEQELYLDNVSGAEVDNRARLITTAYNGADRPGGLGINGSQLRADSVLTVDKMRAVEVELLDRLKEHNEGLAVDATTTAWVFLAITLATLIAAVVFTLIVARALSRPLRDLRSSALEVAYVRLPEAVRRILADPNPIEASRNAITPVPVHTREEIGELARSFDVVHERAIRLAAEQALLRENVNGIFVNLSRRSQRLVERQLGIIDRLESDEQDPDQLASLFELDHLATRLRRNGESLLVLSGAGLTKSMSKPVPAADVIGAAVSEIEQYSRVELGTIPEVSVHGRAVHDLVHLLAELLDNATYFSEPETAISVRAVVTRRNSLAVQITDRGVGMSDQQLTEANDRLADPPDLDVSVTRRMGLYVVARLAKRHGIEVRLRENEDIEGGVIARVVVPTDLLTGAVRPTGTTATVPPYDSGKAPAPGTSHTEVSSPSLFPSTPDLTSGGVAPGATIPPLPAPRGSAEQDPPGGRS
ncbi:sensor histidine kinase, partial [Saccharomonospora iraqiensis]|uniref:sensor histidine kinase n=1 Tax=Saccharomonospora iraqiensis TaxID=52698 RepID=UPI0006974294